MLEYEDILLPGEMMNEQMAFTLFTEFTGVKQTL
jgi:hypothetical protein